MVKNFDLGTVLSAATGTSCVDDFNKVYEIAYFILDDKLITALGLVNAFPIMRNHIITIYPELRDVMPRLNDRNNIDVWVNLQKEKYGEELPIPQLGDKLEEKELVKKKLPITSITKR